MFWWEDYKGQVLYQDDVAQLSAGGADQGRVGELDEDADGGDGQHDADAGDADGHDGEDGLPAHVLVKKDIGKFKLSELVNKGSYGKDYWEFLTDQAWPEPAIFSLNLFKHVIVSGSTAKGI